MAIVLGIDTGGTYTDAVLVDHESGAIVASAKAPTTHERLESGIHAVIERVLAAGDGQQADVQDVRLVSVSTTLATNAIAEGRGAPICALLIGYRQAIPNESVLQVPEFDLPQARYAFVNGGHNAEGVEVEPLDMWAVRAAAVEHAQHVAAFAVSGYFGTRNPEHELAAKRLIQELTGLPVTCGHELTHQLDAIRRAVTVNLNATLIPLLSDLIAAVERTMDAMGIRAPLMVVKGDGSLMASAYAKERPVETILSGPAASVVGAQHLAGGLDDMVVVDMGGTTTDIAVIQAGHPRLSPQGARVGRWHTMVEAIEAHTAGLGGDSRVWLDSDHTLRVGPTRVLPLCALVSQYPAVLEVLRRQDGRTKPASSDGEFLLLRAGDSGARWDAAEQPPFHAQLLQALQNAPLALEDVLGMMEHPFLYRRYLEHLERLGVVMRAGLTPTDAAHAEGAYEEWEPEAAQLGVRLLARRMGCRPEELSARILAQTSERIAEEVVHKLWNDDRHNGHHGMDQAVLSLALRPSPANSLQCAFVVKPDLVAVGAPVRTYFPKVAELLHNHLRIPENTGVANAYGAVAGSVVCRVRALVLPLANDAGYRLHLPDEVRGYRDLEEACQYAAGRVRALAQDGAERAGATGVRIQLQRRDQRAPVNSEWGDEVLLQTCIDATAVGRPRLAQD